MGTHRHQLRIVHVDSYTQRNSSIHLSSQVFLEVVLPDFTSQKSSTQAQHPIRHSCLEKEKMQASQTATTVFQKQAEIAQSFRGMSPLRLCSVYLRLSAFAEHNLHLELL
jgi:hypothetical protein